MSFSEIELARVDKVVGGLCRKRNRPELRDQLSLEYRVSRQDVVVFERRPRWDGRRGHTEHPVAKVKFIRKQGEWRLFWMRADLKWHAYPPLARSGQLERLVAEIDRDPHACFFG
jgi:hypothetical protein